MGRKNNLHVLQERFDRYHIPEPNTGCWLWLGATNNHGYGNVGVNYRTVPAHRASWLVHNGEIPKGLHVCHRCDNPPCVNPGHLFLGTNEDNMRDMAQKGRSSHGERNGGGGKLTAAQVEEIRRLFAEGRTGRDIAPAFGIDESTALRVGAGRIWGRVPGPLRDVRGLLSSEDVQAIRECVARGEPRADIAARFGVNRKTVFNIANGRTRRD